MSVLWEAGLFWLQSPGSGPSDLLSEFCGVGADMERIILPETSKYWAISNIALVPLYQWTIDRTRRPPSQTSLVSCVGSGPRASVMVPMEPQQHQQNLWYLAGQRRCPAGMGLYRWTPRSHWGRLHWEPGNQGNWRLHLCPQRVEAWKPGYMQMGKLRHRVIKSLNPGHRAVKWQNPDLNADLVDFCLFYWTVRPFRRNQRISKEHQ